MRRRHMEKIHRSGLVILLLGLNLLGYESTWLKVIGAGLLVYGLYIFLKD
jgi:hypothetical protein